MNVVSTYVPQKFMWWLFISGEILILFAFLKVWYENIKKSSF